MAAAATITDLQQASKALQGKGGMDPFPAAMQVLLTALSPYTAAAAPSLKLSGMWGGCLAGV